MSDTVRLSSSLLLSGGYGVNLHRLTTYTDEERERRKESLRACIERMGGTVHAINDTNIRDLVVVDVSLPKEMVGVLRGMQTQQTSMGRKP